MRLYEKRHEYTRTRMVQLAPYLVADSVDSYRTDYIDRDNVDAVFDPAELDQGLAFRGSIPSDLMTLLRDWTVGFCPLNSIERAVSDLIRRAPVERGGAHVRGRGGRGRDRDARAGRRPGRLHREQLATPKSPDSRLG